MSATEEQAQARALIKAVYDDGEATINDRVYTFMKMKHKARRKVFAFYSRVSGMVQNRDMSFLDSPDFESVEKVLNESVAYNDSLLSKLGDAHWEKYPSDYVTFIMTALPAISYPFFPEDPTD